MKNIRKRVDGRWEYRKYKNKTTYSIIKNTQKELLQAIKHLGLKESSNSNKSKTFYNLTYEWYNLFKKGQIKTDKRYIQVIESKLNNNLFNTNINKITLEELQYYLNSIKEHRVAKYVYHIIKGVYKYALQKDFIKKDISQFIQAPKNKGKKGEAFTLEEQKLIINNLDKCSIKLEILFYLLTGCRREEAKNIKILPNNTIFIDGTKTQASRRYVKISEAFKEILDKNYDNMFQYHSDIYTRNFKQYVNNLGIYGKTLHDLRHTFSTNLYYLGVPDKERQYLMGHSSIVMTNDIYTTLDPNTTKEDILKLYNNLYPKF